MEATPRNLDATPRNLVIGEDIANDCLDTNIFRDGRGCHLHVVGEFLELLLLLATQGEVDWLHLPEVMAGLVLGYGKGHSSTPADPMSSDLSDTAMVSPRAFTEFIAVVATARRVWTCVSKTEKARDQRRNPRRKGSIA